MASLLYGVKTLETPVIKLPVAADQTFYHQGHAFVLVDGNGHVAIATDADATIFGYAIIPSGMGAGTVADTWVSSATSAADFLAVVPAGSGAQFLVPSTDTVAATQIGNACDISADGITIDSGVSTTNVLVIDDVGTKWGGPAASALVRINPIKGQADTT